MRKKCLFGYKCIVVMGVLEMLGPYSDGFAGPDGDGFVEGGGWLRHKQNGWIGVVL